MFFFHIQPKYCLEKCCIFFQATLLYKMIEPIINGAGDCWIEIGCVRHIDVAECWKLEGKFTDVQHRHNVHTKVREYRLRNPNFNLVKPIRSPRQRGHLKSLLTSVWRRKVSKTRHFVSGPYKIMCTVNTSNHQVKKHLSPFFSLEFFCKALQSHLSANLTLRSTYVPGSTAVVSLMIVSGILLLLSAVVLLIGATNVCCTFTLFRIW
jgi:hypothetical protein